MLGCERVLVDGVTVRNFMDLANCDGIDSDHCRDIEIRNCDIVSADDAIVIKTSDQSFDYGPSQNITVKDCRVTSRDSGLTIGTETFDDISKIRFERCVIQGGRGPTITHRQRGNISDIEFDDIQVVAQHHAARWWGTGEAINISVRPRIENRPTMPGVEGLEPHDTPVFSLRNARHVVLKACKDSWGDKHQLHYGPALEVENVADLKLVGFETQALVRAR